MSFPMDQDFVLDRDSHYELVVPEKSLAPYSLQVRGNGGEYGEMYTVLQKAAASWNDFFVYTSTEGPSLDQWEFIPYSRESYAWTQQFSVLWSVIRGAASQNIEQRNVTLQAYKNRMIPISTQNLTGTDAFCKQEVIERQRVFSKEKVEVLFNYAPQGQEHFLIIPKKHRTDFRDLQKDEFIEAMQAAEKIARHYTSQGLTCYLYHKTGAWAGQTVPHWHLHVVVVDPKNAFIEKLLVGWRMLVGARPLSSEALKDRIQKVQQELPDLSK